MPLFGIAFSGGGNQPTEKVRYVNVQFQSSDIRRSDLELLNIMLSAIQDRRASITPTAIGTSMASSLIYSIEVNGRYRNSTDIYNKAEEYVLRWRVEAPKRGLPFPRRAIF